MLIQIHAEVADEADSALVHIRNKHKITQRVMNQTAVHAQGHGNRDLLAIYEETCFVMIHTGFREGNSEAAFILVPLEVFHAFQFLCPELGSTGCPFRNRTTQDEVRQICGVFIAHAQFDRVLRHDGTKCSV